ncbi:hypothetical protein [Streptomyces sp. 5-10]|nr:hypothetical protein [Streptomyces sp. 5-10]
MTQQQQPEPEYPDAISVPVPVDNKPEAIGVKPDIAQQYDADKK